jgi:REP element-mobilizing transposase RayT
MDNNPTKFANKFKLNSSRLQNWDYSTPGYYFITICTYNHNNFFGKIINNKMELSIMGIIAKSELLKTFEIRKNIKLHEWVIMPNHIHILMEIKNEINNIVETPCVASLQIDNKYKILNQKSNQLISKTIQQFKSAVTRQINPKTIFFAWQPRFHDQIIKEEKQLLIIKKYIKDNVINWSKDKYFK